MPISLLSNWFGGEDEAFSSWYLNLARKFGLPEDPDDPRNRYDYRQAWKQGASVGQHGELPDYFLRVKADPPAMIAAGSKPAIPQKGGGISTEKTISFEMDGRHYVIPTIIDGVSYTTDAAERMMMAGKVRPLAVFDNEDDAVRYAEDRSRSLDKAFGGEGVLHKGPSDPVSGEVSDGYRGIIDLATGKPRSIPGALPGLNEPDQEHSIEDPVAKLAKSLLIRLGENTGNYLDLTGEGVGALANAAQDLPRAGDPFDTTGLTTSRLPYGLQEEPTPQPPAIHYEQPEWRKKLHYLYEKEREDFANPDAPVASALVNTGLDVVTDPLNFLVGEAAPKGGGELLDEIPYLRGLNTPVKDLPLVNRLFPRSQELTELDRLALGKQGVVDGLSIKEDLLPVDKTPSSVVYSNATNPEGSFIPGSMEHGGSDVSPEAINRVAQGNRYYRIRQGGEAVPIVNDVAAVDARVNPGEIKVQVGQDGQKIILEGRPNSYQMRALEDLDRVTTVADEPESAGEYFLDLDDPEGSGLEAPGRRGGGGSSNPLLELGAKVHENPSVDRWVKLEYKKLDLEDASMTSDYDMDKMDRLDELQSELERFMTEDEVRDAHAIVEGSYGPPYSQNLRGPIGRAWDKATGSRQQIATHYGYGEPMPLYKPEGALPVDITKVKDSEPLPLPELGDGVSPDEVIDSWNVFSTRHPMLAARVKGFRRTGKSSPFYASDGYIYMPGSQWGGYPELSFESLFHEATHVAQDRGGAIQKFFRNGEYGDAFHPGPARDKLQGWESQAVWNSRPYGRFGVEGHIPSAVEDLTFLNDSELRDRAALIMEDLALEPKGSLAASRMRYTLNRIHEELASHSPVIDIGKSTTKKLPPAPGLEENLGDGDWNWQPPNRETFDPNFVAEDFGAEEPGGVIGSRAPVSTESPRDIKFRFSGKRAWSDYRTAHENLEMRREFGDQLLNDATFYLEKTGNPYAPKGEQEYWQVVKRLEHTEKGRKLIDYIDNVWRKKTDELHSAIKDLGVEDIGYVENYVKHVWQVPEIEAKRMARNILRSTDPFMHQRSLGTFEQGIKAGYVPKTINFADLRTITERAYDNVMATHELLQEIGRMGFMSDGNPSLAIAVPKSGEYHQVNVPALARLFGEEAAGKKVYVHSDIYHELKPILTATNVTRVDESLSTIKAMNLAFSLFHPFSLLESSITTFGLPRGLLESAKGGMGIPGVAGASRRLSGSISRALSSLAEIDAPAAVKRQLEHIAAVFGEPGIEVAQDGIMHGLELSKPETDVMQSSFYKALDRVARQTSGVPVLGKGMRKDMEMLAAAKKVFDKALWDQFQSPMKLQAYQATTSRLMKARQGKGIAGKLSDGVSSILGQQKIADMTDTEIKRTAAKFVNDEFGGQRWDLIASKFWSDPKMNKVLRRVFTSPDWNYSSISAATTPFSRNPARRALGFRHYVNYAVGVYGMQNVMNYVFTDIKGDPHFMWDNEPGHKFDVETWYTKGNKKAFWGVSKQMMEAMDFVTGRERSDGTRELPAIGFLARKVLPIWHAIAAITSGHTLSGFPSKASQLEEKVDRPLTVGERITTTADQLAGAFMPFSAQRGLEERNPSKLLVPYPESTGMSRIRAKNMLYEAYVSRDQEQAQEIIRALYENGFQGDDVDKIIAEAQRKMLRDTLEVQ